jgi:hypothetical protein
LLGRSIGPGTRYRLSFLKLLKERAGEVVRKREKRERERERQGSRKERR